MSHTYEVAGAFLGEIPGMINYATEMKIIYEHFGLDEVRRPGSVFFSLSLQVLARCGLLGSASQGFV